MIFQSIQTALIQRLVGDAVVAQGAAGAEEGTQVHVGRQPGAAEIHVVIAGQDVFHIALGILGVHRGGQALFGEHDGDVTGGLEPEGVVLVDQQYQIPVHQGHILHGFGKFLRIILVFGIQAVAVMGEIGGCRQGHSPGEALVVFFDDGRPVNGVGQGGPEGGGGEDLPVGHIAGKEDHLAVFAVPQLVVAAVVGIEVGAGIGADQVQVIELEFVPDLGRRLRQQQRDGISGDGQAHLIGAPPAAHPAQIGAGNGAVEGVGTGAQGSGGAHLGGLHHGDVQQNGQILHGGIQPEDQGLPFHPDGLHMGEAAAVIIGVLSGVVAGLNVLDGDRGAVGEGGAVNQIEGVGLHVLGYRVPVTEDGHRLVVAVGAEQALVDQGEQGTVGIVGGGEGVHGAAGVVDEGQFLGIFRLRGGFLHAGGVHDELAAGGDKFTVLGHAAHQSQAKAQAQDQGNVFFHAPTS